MERSHRRNCKQIIKNDRSNEQTKEHIANQSTPDDLQCANFTNIPLLQPSLGKETREPRATTEKGYKDSEC